MADGIILMYDITDQNSFKNLRYWIKQIQANAKTNTCILLVGNKVDKPNRVVTKEEGEEFSDEFSLSFYESSAKTNQNIYEAFLFLVGEILKSRKLINDKNINDKNINNNLKLYKFLNY